MQRNFLLTLLGFLTAASPLFADLECESAIARHGDASYVISSSSEWLDRYKRFVVSGLLPREAHPLELESRYLQDWGFDPVKVAQDREYLRSFVMGTVYDQVLSFTARIVGKRIGEFQGGKYLPKMAQYYYSCNLGHAGEQVRYTEKDRWRRNLLQSFEPVSEVVAHLRSLEPESKEKSEAYLLKELLPVLQGMKAFLGEVTYRDQMSTVIHRDFRGQFLSRKGVMSRYAYPASYSLGGLMVGVLRSIDLYEPRKQQKGDPSIMLGFEGLTPRERSLLLPILFTQVEFENEPLGAAIGLGPKLGGELTSYYGRWIDALPENP